MKWSNEMPKEHGWYWVKITVAPEVVYLAPNVKTVWLTGESKPRNAEEYFRWGDKLETPQ